MRSSDLMDMLAKIEARFPVHEWVVAGVPVWPLVRIRWYRTQWARLYASAAAAPAAGSARKRLVDLWRGPLRAAATQLGDRAARERRPVRRDLLFVSDGISFAKLGALWFDRFCDPLIALARQRGLNAALWTMGHDHRVPRATPSRFVQPLLDRANAVGALRQLIGFSPPSLPGNEQLRAWVTSCGLGDESLRPSKIASDAMRVRELASAYRRRLRRVQPRLAFVVNYYSLEGMAFVLACRESGTMVVDVQHGLQGDLHPAYGAWPRPKSAVHSLLPDRFWVWSSWEREVIARWSDGTGHCAVLGGNPWMRVWQEGEQWPGVAQAHELARALRARAEGRPVVLVTLQYGFNASEQIEPLSRLLSVAAGRFAFWVRLHPMMLERRAGLSALLRAGVCCELQQPTDLPLQALLPYVDVHMTYSSSVVIEAAQFGIRSVITSLYGAELFEPLSLRGWVETAIGDDERLMHVLERLAAAKRQGQESAGSAEAALDSLLEDAAHRAGRGEDS